MESVQGDERSVIYFSVTYGPDLAGRVTMNFGPLTHEGGERRLNVAITRARKEMHIFSSMRPEQIDLSRTRAEGVRDLKHFMEFAERGPRALAEAVFGSKGDFESPFESQVAVALRSKGWQVHPQIGVSAFRIDLGIVHPEMAGRYLCGIECDGATYHRSATARNRDYLREQVLRNLGWEILRVWSTDWWTDRDSTVERLHSELSRLLERSQREMESVADDERSARLVASREPATDASDSSSFQLTDDLADSLDLEGSLVRESASDLPKATNEGTSDEDRTYTDPDRFFETSYTRVLRELVDTIIHEQAPIRLDILAQQIARKHGFQRTGARILKRVQAVVGRRYPKTREGENTFVWSKDSEPGEWDSFRISETPMPVDQICIQELMAMARHVRDQGFSGEEAIREIASFLGLSRLRHAARARLMLAMRKMEN